MQKLFKHLTFILLLTTIYLKTEAQTSNSPYTMFGAGLVSNSSFGASRGMGGTGVGSYSQNGLNNLNPASYSGIDSLSFIFEIGVSGKYTSFRSSGSTNNQFDANLDYLALGFRINKWIATSVGITPISSTKYNINSTFQIAGSTTNFPITYIGEGGINKFYLANSFRLGKNFSAGINLSYNLGSIKQYEIVSENSLIDNYTLTSTQYIHNLFIDYGVIYTGKIGATEIGLGITYGNKKALDTKSDYYFYSDFDTVLIDAEKSSFLIPQNYSIGLSINYNNKIRFGADYHKEEWSASEFSNPLLKIRDSDKYSIGIEFTPSVSQRAKSFEKISYRLGAYYNKSYLIIKNHALNQNAITFGVGIPTSKRLSRINISMEAGKYGTLADGLIKESYFQCHVNFSLQDIWFQKAKFD